MNTSQKSLQSSADPYVALLGGYLLADRMFYADPQVLNYLKAEIWAAIESREPDRIKDTLAMVTAAIASEGSTVVEAAALRDYQLREKRAQRRAEA
jgi:hypothetical protein